LGAGPPRVFCGRTIFPPQGRGGGQEPPPLGCVVGGPWGKLGGGGKHPGRSGNFAWPERGGGWAGLPLGGGTFWVFGEGKNGGRPFPSLFFTFLFFPPPWVWCEKERNGGRSFPYAQPKRFFPREGGARFPGQGGGKFFRGEPGPGSPEGWPGATTGQSGAGLVPWPWGIVGWGPQNWGGGRGGGEVGGAPGTERVWIFFLGFKRPYGVRKGAFSGGRGGGPWGPGTTGPPPPPALFSGGAGGVDAGSRGQGTGFVGPPGFGPNLAPIFVSFGAGSEGFPPPPPNRASGGGGLRGRAGGETFGRGGRYIRRSPRDGFVLMDFGFFLRGAFPGEGGGGGTGAFGGAFKGRGRRGGTRPGPRAGRPGHWRNREPPGRRAPTPPTNGSGSKMPFGREPLAPCRGGVGGPRGGDGRGTGSGRTPRGGGGPGGTAFLTGANIPPQPPPPGGPTS